MQPKIEEEVEPKENSKSKKKEKNNAFRLTWLILIWLLLNSIWTIQHNVGSTNEVQRSGLAVIPSHPFDVPNMLGAGKSVQFEISCTFTDRIENRTNSVPVSWELRDSFGSILSSWNGSVNASSEECLTYNTHLKPGSYTINTILPEGEGYINVDMEFKYWIFKSFVMEGYVIANLIGFLFMINEISFKRIKKGQQSNDWESKEIVNLGNDAEVNDFDFDSKSNISNEQEQSRRAYEDEMRRLAEEAEKKEEEKVVEKEKSVKQGSDQESLGDGTTKGLGGKATIDKSIQTVSDLYDLMKKKK